MSDRSHRQRRRRTGGGGAVAVNDVTRCTIVWVVCLLMQGTPSSFRYFWRPVSSPTTSSSSSSFLLLVEGASFFRPFGVFSAAATTATTAISAADTNAKQDDGPAKVDQQQQPQQQTALEAAADEESHPSEEEAEDNDDMENLDSNRQNNNTRERSNHASAGNHKEGEEEEASWFQDMEFEDYNEAATVSGATSNVEPTTTTAAAALDDSQLHPMLQIPLAVSLLNDAVADTSTNKKKKNHIRAIRAYCDTGATRTVMSYESARRLGWLTQLDRRYAGQATSVGGSCRVLGRLPAGLVEFHLHHVNNNNHNKIGNANEDRMITLQSPTITVLEDLPCSSTTCNAEDGGFELLLGLDFLREYQAILDLRNEELRLLVKRKEYSIPFVRPRSSIASCKAPHDDTAMQDSERHQETQTSTSSKWGEFTKRGRSRSFDDDNDDDDEYEDFDRVETLDMSGV